MGEALSVMLPVKLGEPVDVRVAVTDTSAVVLAEDVALSVAEGV